MEYILSVNIIDVASTNDSGMLPLKESFDCTRLTKFNLIYDEFF